MAPDAEDDSWAAAAAYAAAPPPPRPVGCAGGEAALWWRFALRRVREEVRRQRGWRMGRGFFEARRKARLRYVELYKRSQARRTQRRSQRKGGSRPRPTRVVLPPAVLRRRRSTLG